MVRPKTLAITIAVFVLSPRLSSADTLWLGSTDRNAIKVEGAKIQQFADGKLAYTTNSGSQISKHLEELQQIDVNGEPNFDAAEIAFAATDYSAALSSYKLALEGSSKDWVKLRSAIRLTQTGKAAGRYDAQVAGYAALVQINPIVAAAYKPSDPTIGSPNLDPALASLQKTINGATLDSSQKTTLLTLQLQINRAQGNTSQANTTLEQLGALGSVNPMDIAALKLASATIALDAKQYAQAIDLIDQSRALFTDPSQQVDALFLLAQAKFGMDGDKTDGDTLKDLALGYMRVVTFGSALPNRPHVAESLYKAGQLEEKLKEPQAALQLYQQVAHDKSYADSPVVPQAKAAVDRLAKEGK